MDTSQLDELLYLSLAVGVICYTISKGVIFESLRWWIEDRNAWLGKLTSCFYCLSHWVSLAAVLVFQTRLVHSGVGVLDYLVSAFALTATSTLVSALLWRALVPPKLPPHIMEGMSNGKTVVPHRPAKERSVP